MATPYDSQIAVGDIWRRFENGRERHLLITRLFELLPDEWVVEIMLLDNRSIETYSPEWLISPISWDFQYERLSKVE